MKLVNFVNPYNFIPLGKQKAAAEEKEGTLTGVIEYSVYTKTPLFIPNTSNRTTFSVNTEEEHVSYDFFSYTDLSDTSKTYETDYASPVIPGSEIRGMLRSNYEILTNSCLSAIDDNVVLSKRTAETFQPGLIKKNADGSYDLYQAEDHLWRTKGENSQEDELHWKDNYYTRKCYRQKDLPEGSMVYFEREARGKKIKPLARNVSLEKGRRNQIGYLLKGEDGPVIETKGKKVNTQKHCGHIFTLGKACVEKRISLSGLKTALQEYEKNEEHPYTEYRKELKKFEESGTKEYFPVYYSKPTKHLMLSPACITREIYQNRLKDMVGSFNACKNRNHLCPACSLFGTIGKDFQVSSRIRFSDLLCEESRDPKSCYQEPVTLLPLSSPKLNNMEFYLKKPEDAWFWTYDYYVNADGRLVEYLPELNGRKFYWHQMNVTLPKGVKPTKLNMTIRPVREKVTFSGKLYFHKLTEKELNTLLWLLNAGEEGALEERGHGYKLGAAKPLGLGSIAIAVDRVCLRKLVRDEEAHTIRMEENTDFGCRGLVTEVEEELLQQFRKMTDFQAVKGKRVCYPTVREEQIADEELNGYEWFVANHKGYSHKKGTEVGMPNTRNDMYYQKYLKAMEPELLETCTGKGPKTPGYPGRVNQNSGGSRNSGNNRNKMPGKPKGNSQKERRLAASVTKNDSKGIWIKVEGMEGCIQKNGALSIQAQLLKPGDSVEVCFVEEKPSPRGKGMIRYYRLL